MSIKVPSISASQGVVLAQMAPRIEAAHQAASSFALNPHAKHRYHSPSLERFRERNRLRGRLIQKHFVREGYDAVLPRIQRAMAGLSGNAKARGDYTTAVLFQLGWEGYEATSGEVDLFHYLATQLVGVAEILSGENHFISLNDEMGDLHNHLRLPYKCAKIYEREQFNNLRPGDRTKITDIMYMFAAWGDMQYAVRFQRQGEIIGVLLQLSNVIHRYRILGQRQKMTEAQLLLDKTRERFGIASRNQQRLILMAARERAGAGEGLAMLVDERIDGSLIAALGEEAGYASEAWLNHAVAGQLEGTPRDVFRAAEFHRDKATEAQRIGVALGFIE